MSTRCPICQLPTKPATENPTAPFCSSRCQTIDLGNWLTERYRVPTSEPDELFPDNRDSDGDADAVMARSAIRPQKSWRN